MSITDLALAVGFLTLLLRLLTAKSFFPLFLLICVLLHEGGHALALRLLRGTTGKMTTEPLGLRLSLGSSPLSYSHEFRIALAGPLANLLSGGLIFLLFRVPIAADFALLSLSVAFMSLLPLSDNDGGRILSSLLLRFVSPDATRKLLRLATLFSLFFLWSFSVYSMIQNGESFSLFLFTVCLFCRTFLSSGYSEDF